MGVEALLLLSVVAAVAAAVHAAVGFGSGPLLVPALLLFVAPPTAVVAAIAVGMAVNGLQLGAERRRPHPPVPEVLVLGAGAVPGAAAGAVLAGQLGADALAGVVAGVLVVCAAATLAAPARLPRWTLAAGGAVAGVSAAVTGVFGPLLGVLLVGSGGKGDALRDGIGLAFLLVGACGMAAALAAAPEWDGLALAALLLPPAAAGHALGRRGFTRLGPAAHRGAVLATVLVGCVAALAGALA